MLNLSCSDSERLLIKAKDKYVCWNRPFRELSEVCQQIAYPETATSCFGGVDRTDALLRRPEAGRGKNRVGKKKQKKHRKHINMTSVHDMPFYRFKVHVSHTVPGNS